MIQAYNKDGEMIPLMDKMVELAQEHECCDKYAKGVGYKPFLTHCEIMIAEGRPVYQATANMKGPFSRLNLKRVFGNLSIGGCKDQVFFYPPHQDANNKLNCHCWLEDKEGEIFDIATSMMEAIALCLDKKFKFDGHEVLLVGYTKRVIAAKGLRYHPFPPEMQVICEMEAVRQMQEQ